MMLRTSRNWALATGVAIALALTTPGLANAQGAPSAGHSTHAVAVGANNRTGSAAVHIAGTSHATPLAASPSTQPQVRHPFPSSASTVVGSVGFINDTEVGYFWSASRGDKVEQSFSGPGAITKAVLKLDVIENVLAAGSEVDWTMSINGTDTGSFTVQPGQFGLVKFKCTFPKMTGGTYDVKIRVTNEVVGGGGSITLRYAGTGPHKVFLRA